MINYLVENNGNVSIEDSDVKMAFEENARIERARKYRPWVLKHGFIRVVFDLDGTLANVDHRVHLITGKKQDWKLFYEECTNDLPIQSMILMAKSMIINPTFRVEIWTGRSEIIRNSTFSWLNNHGILVEEHESSIFFHTPKTAVLRMRKDDDYRFDYEIKKEWLTNAINADVKPTVVFEDRTSVVEMWRENGIQCCQVAAGNF